MRISPAGVRKFSARCRLTYTDEEIDSMRQCDVDFDDPAQFEDHMTGLHRRTAPTEPALFQRWRPPRRRRTYEPADHKVGAWVTFAEQHDKQIVLRRGQVWSLGPPGVGKSLWVVPEDGGDAVVVRVNQRPMLSSQTLLDVVSGYEMRRMNVRRAENVRRFGGVFPVVVDKRWEYGWTHTKELVEYLAWHVDPDCPDAIGKPAPSREIRPHNAGEVIRDLLTARINASTTRYCRRCFWLDRAEEDRDVSRSAM